MRKIKINNNKLTRRMRSRTATTRMTKTNREIKMKTSKMMMRKNRTVKINRISLNHSSRPMFLASSL
jgi:hypothetical protein